MSPRGASPLEVRDLISICGGAFFERDHAFAFSVCRLDFVCHRGGWRGLYQLGRLAGRPLHEKTAERPAPTARPSPSSSRCIGASPIWNAIWRLSSTRINDGPVQIIFGVHDEADPAIEAVRALQAKYPHCDTAIVADTALYGANAKVSNLINMLPSARHDTLILSDSDIAVGRRWLSQVVAALARPGVGIVHLSLYRRAGARRQQALVVTGGDEHLLHFPAQCRGGHQPGPGGALLRFHHRAQAPDPG